MTLGILIFTENGGDFIVKQTLFYSFAAGLIFLFKLAIKHLRFVVFTELFL